LRHIPQLRPLVAAREEAVHSKNVKPKISTEQGRNQIPYDYREENLLKERLYALKFDVNNIEPGVISRSGQETAGASKLPF